ARFKHSFATTEDLQAVCEKHYKKPLDWFFKEWVYGEFFPSYRVTYTQAKKGKPVELNLEQLKRQTIPAVFKMPMQVLITFDDGTTQVETIENAQEAQKYSFKVPEKKGLQKLTIDPDEWILKQVPVETHIRGTRKIFEVKSLKMAADNSNLGIQIISAKKQDLTAIVYDLLGNEVYKQVFPNVYQIFDGTITPTSPFKPGMYKVKIEGNDVVITQPFTVPRLR
ncbi:MAG: hypothetical protein RI894_1773, partial [Bacteroidota bacterium]